MGLTQAWRGLGDVWAGGVPDTLAGALSLIAGLCVMSLMSLYNISGVSLACGI